MPGEDVDDFVSFMVADQLFGVPVFKVQDVLAPERIASVPLAPPEIEGSIILRGRIVIVEVDGELYALLIDSIGDVIGLSRQAYEDGPASLDPVWSEIAHGVYRLEGRLMVVLDVEPLLDIG